MNRAVLMTGLGICAPFAVATSADSTSYRINGVEVCVDYARGTDASRLIARHLASSPKSADRSPAQWTRRGNWREMASVEGHLSTVLQVRGDGAGTEAIRSTLDLRRTVRHPIGPPLWLPPATEITSSVETLGSDASSQWLARSSWTPAATRTWLRLAARMQGWSVSEPGLQSLQLQRGSARLRVDVFALDGFRARGTSTLITQWIAP